METPARGILPKTARFARTVFLENTHGAAPKKRTPAVRHLLNSRLGGFYSRLQSSASVGTGLSFMKYAILDTLIRCV